MTGSSLLEHSGHMKSMWVECTGFLMRSSYSLRLRIKNCFVTLLHTVFSGRMWKVCTVEQNIWRIIRSCFYSNHSMESTKWRCVAWRAGLMVPWPWQHFEFSLCCIIYTALMMPDENIWMKFLEQEAAFIWMFFINPLLKLLRWSSVYVQPLAFHKLEWRNVYVRLNMHSSTAFHCDIIVGLNSKHAKIWV